MRHRKSGIKLNRTTSHRQAMFRNMVTSLFKFDRIRTTDTKAKELRRLADHVITLAKRGDLHARRQALAILMEKRVVHKLFEEASERFGSTSGGYTRIIKIGHRPGDAAPVSMIELIGGTEEVKKKDKKKKTAPRVTTTPTVSDATKASDSGAVDASEDEAEKVDASAQEQKASGEAAEAVAADEAETIPEKNAEAPQPSQAAAEPDKKDA